MTAPASRPRRFWVYPVVLGYCAVLILLAFLVETPAQIIAGLQTILLTPDGLITDYIALAGLGAALVNAALVSASAAGVLWLTRVPQQGGACAALGLISGFAFFGNDVLNIWPIILGSLLYARARREPLGKYASTGVMATCLSPMVSALWCSGLGWMGILAGTLLGLLIGLLLPLLAGYTLLLLRGMNLYNVGFACGMTALVLVPVLVSAGIAPETVLIWSQGYEWFFVPLLSALCLSAILAGLLLSGGPRSALKGYGALLKRSGRPTDFLLPCGGGAVLINLGVNGLICMVYLLIIGGDLNGPTVGAILTVLGFSANGKHARNILPLMAGAALAGLLLPGFSLTTPAIQFSVLFCTTLAPLCGVFGPAAGLLAGFLHICVVQRTGWAVCGLNLYNNGFTGGVIALFLYPFLSFLRLRRPPTLDEDGL